MFARGPISGVKATRLVQQKPPQIPMAERSATDSLMGG